MDFWRRLDAPREGGNMRVPLPAPSLRGDPASSKRGFYWQSELGQHRSGDHIVRQSYPPYEPDIDHRNWRVTFRSARWIGPRSLAASGFFLAIQAAQKPAQYSIPSRAANPIRKKIPIKLASLKLLDTARTPNKTNTSKRNRKPKTS